MAHVYRVAASFLVMESAPEASVGSAAHRFIDFHHFATRGFADELILDVLDKAKLPSAIDSDQARSRKTTQHCYAARSTIRHCSGGSLISW